MDLFLDIETMDAPSEAIDKKMRTWTPPERYGKDAAERARIKAYQTAKEKAALMNASPICAIGFALEDFDSDEATVLLFRGSEKALLEEFSRSLEHALETRKLRQVHQVIGHNLIGFDLPKLRAAYLRHLIDSHMIPAFLRLSVDRHYSYSLVNIIDTQVLAGKFLDAETTKPSLKSLADIINAPWVDPLEGPPTEGKDIPRLFAEGQYQAVVDHCRADVINTRAIYERLDDLF